MKKIIFIFIIFLIIISSVIFSLINTNQTIMITAIQKSYSCVSTYEENDTFEVILYLSNKRSSITNKKMINNCYISDENTLDQIKLELLEIQDLKYNEKIKNQNFHLFSYVFEIKSFVDEEYELNFNKATLLFETSDNSYNIKLGSFYYYKMPFYGDNEHYISISKLSPILEKVKGNKTIVALNMIISNDSKNDIEIINVKLLNSIVYPSLEEILIEKNINIQKSLSSLLGYNYQLFNDIVEEEFVDLEIKKNSGIEILIPLKYRDYYNINTIGFVLNYQIKGENDIHKYYFDDFIFFTSNNIIVNEDEMVISRYENS